ncbi:MAG: DUF979 domain-containing protein [Rudaea sp.]
MLRIEYAYWLCGIFLGVCALIEARRRRVLQAAFWGILSLCFIGGDIVESAFNAGDKFLAQTVGAAVVALAILAGSGRLKRHPEFACDSDVRRISASKLGNKLFLPALLIPIGTLILALTQPWLHIGDAALFDSHQATLTALAVACVIALFAAMSLTRSNLAAAGTETARLLDALSWAAVLPMLLATLGGVFAATGVGDAVGHLSAMAIPADSRVACVLAYALGMVAFTVIMGNAFAAFPVMTAGIGLPLLVVHHHANPAALGALGMLSGYCGTLLTPMAANFNVVPAALLELRDPNGVIKAQWQTAAWVFQANIILMYFLAFR